MVNKKLIYIVDDVQMQRELLADHLTANMPAYEIHCFSTGEECIAAAKVRPAEIIFLDYNLNSQVKDAMDGIEALQELKSIAPQTEVVMISGQDKIEVAVNTIKHGAFDYIVKGEGAFVRAEKVVFNIYRFHKLTVTASRYKTLMILFGIGMLLMVILVIFLQNNGYIRNSPGWY
jgi:DNA-binding NtrC family response regulator